jgi:hypothetical protein
LSARFTTAKGAGLLHLATTEVKTDSPVGNLLGSLVLKPTLQPELFWLAWKIAPDTCEVSPIRWAGQVDCDTNHYKGFSATPVRRAWEIIGVSAEWLRNYELEAYK